MDKVLIDTNVWVYLFDIDANAEKREILVEVFRRLAREGWQIFLCSQVCKEFVRVGVEKYGYPRDYLEDRIERIRDIANIIYEDCEDVRTAIQLKEHYNLQFWDSVVIAVALNNGIPYILTEDVTYRRIQFKDKRVELLNPFGE